MTITSTPTPSASPTAGGGLSAAEQRAAEAFGASVNAANTAGRVYMGGIVNYGAPKGMSAQGRKQLSEESRQETRPSWWSTDGATNQYFNWTQKQRDDFRAKGLLSGLLTAGAGDLEAYSLWGSLVSQAALYGAQNQPVGPLDILSGYVKANSSGGWIKSGDFETNPVTGEKRYIGPQFKTTTQTNANLSDPATARALATQVFQQLLGRDPGQGEISSYAQALAQSEQSNPSQATTTTQYDMTTGEASNSSTVTTGGMTDAERGQLAEDRIKGGKEYGATQAATTYMNALQSAVGGGG